MQKNFRRFWLGSVQAKKTVLVTPSPLEKSDRKSKMLRDCQLYILDRSFFSFKNSRFGKNFRAKDFLIFSLVFLLGWPKIEILQHFPAGNFFQFFFLHVKSKIILVIYTKFEASLFLLTFYVKKLKFGDILEPEVLRFSFPFIFCQPLNKKSKFEQYFRNKDFFFLLVWLANHEATI